MEDLIHTLEYANHEFHSKDGFEADVWEYVLEFDWLRRIGEGLEMIQNDDLVLYR